MEKNYDEKDNFIIKLMSMTKDDQITWDTSISDGYYYFSTNLPVEMEDGSTNSLYLLLYKEQLVIDNFLVINNKDLVNLLNEQIRSDLQNKIIYKMQKINAL